MMIRIFQIIIVCYACMVLFVSFDFSEANNEPKRAYHRQKRFLSFENISHFFFRVNFKANMVPWNQIFAKAIGFRINWDEPPDSFHPYHHLHRRTVYSHVETLLDRNGLQGFHCVRRAICEMDRISQPRGIYYKVLKMVFRVKEKWVKSMYTCRVVIDQWSDGAFLVQYTRIIRLRPTSVRISSTTDKWHNRTAEDCLMSIAACPFSMLEVSLYTDY